MGIFLPYQWRWIQDRSRIKLVEKSRQIGFSWATAYDIVRQQSRKAVKLDSWISSRDEIQARLFLQDCRKFAGLLNIAASEIVERVLKAYPVQGNPLFVFAVARLLDEFIKEVMRPTMGGDYCHLPAPCNAGQCDGVEHLRILVQGKFVKHACAALARLRIWIG